MCKKLFLTFVLVFGFLFFGANVRADTSSANYDWEIANLTFPNGILSYGRDLTVAYQIKNNSNVDKEAEFRVAFYLDDVYVKDINYVAPTDALKAGETKNYSATISSGLLKQGAQVIELKLIVNWSESNSLNNKVGAGINILQNNKVDFIVTEVGVKYFDQGNAGKYYYAIVKNTGESLTFTGNNSSGILGINFYGSSGWLGSLDESVVYSKKEYTSNQTI